MDAREANHFAKLKTEEQEAERKKLAAMSDEQRARYEKELADAKAHDEKKKRGVLKTKAAFSGGAGLVKTAGRGGRGGGGAGRGGRGRGGRGGGGSEGSATTRASDEAIGPNAGAEGESDPDEGSCGQEDRRRRSSTPHEAGDARVADEARGGPPLKEK